MDLDDLISRCTASPDDRWDICAELYNALEAGGQESIDLAPYALAFASFWRDVDEHVRPFQEESGHSWRWQDDYQDPRNEAGLLLDILGYVPGDVVVAELHHALTLSDPHLVMFAAVALLRQRRCRGIAHVDDEGRGRRARIAVGCRHRDDVRADREQRSPVNGQVEARILESLKHALQDADAFVVSDYDKGVVTPRILGEILKVAYERVPVLIDPKIRNFSHYRPASLITPNHYEALRMTNTEEDSDEALHQAALPVTKRTE